jgi:hypothetical protein
VTASSINTKPAASNTIKQTTPPMPIRRRNGRLECPPSALILSVCVSKQAQHNPGVWWSGMHTHTPTATRVMAKLCGGG